VIQQINLIPKAELAFLVPKNNLEISINFLNCHSSSTSNLREIDSESIELMSGWSTPSDFKNSDLKSTNKSNNQLAENQVKTLKKKSKQFHFDINELRKSGLQNESNLAESQYTMIQGRSKSIC
jgi:hypothetical protein